MCFTQNHTCEFKKKKNSNNTHFYIAVFIQISRSEHKIAMGGLSQKEMWTNPGLFPDKRPFFVLTVWAT